VAMLRICVSGSMARTKRRTSVTYCFEFVENGFVFLKAQSSQKSVTEHIFLVTGI
jgi:hypothetical protein